MLKEYLSIIYCVCYIGSQFVSHFACFTGPDVLLLIDSVLRLSARQNGPQNAKNENDHCDGAE